MEKETAPRTDWRIGLFFVPQLIVIALVIWAAGGAIGYPWAVLIGVAVAFFGTLTFGDCPTTAQEFGCGGVITLVLVAIMIPVFTQAHQKRQERRAQASHTAKATPKPSPSATPP